MTRYVISGGYIYKASDKGKAFYEAVVEGIENRPVKILDCLFARPEDIWEEKYNEDKKYFSEFIENPEVLLAKSELFIDQLKECDVLFIQGGTPWLAMNILNSIEGWMEHLEGKIVAASSAGVDVLATYYYVGKTMRIGEGLGLLPIKFIPHWQSDHGKEIVIDWNKGLEELKAYKEDMEIVLLKDGEFKVIEK